MKKVIIILLGVVLAVAVGALLLAFQGYDPIVSYVSILKNSLFSKVAIGNTFSRSAILLMVGLSAFVALSSGASNLGQFGQLLSGAMAATLVGLYVSAPAFVVVPLMLLAAAVCGALYASIAAACKHFFGMNEFITTLMLNFIAEYFTTYLVTDIIKDPKAAWPMSSAIPKAAIFKSVGFFDTSVFLALALFCALFIFWYKTRKGYELRISGKNNIFARNGGCTTDKNFISTMMLSGALAGIAGAFLIMGSMQQHKFIPALGKANGSDGLMIAIISGSSMPSVLFFAFFFGVLQTGAVGMQLDAGVPMEFTIILQAIMTLLVVAFRDYSDIFLNKLAARSKISHIRRVDS